MEVVTTATRSPLAATNAVGIEPSVPITAFLALAPVAADVLASLYLDVRAVGSLSLPVAASRVQARFLPLLNALGVRAILPLFS